MIKLIATTGLWFSLASGVYAKDKLPKMVELEIHSKNLGKGDFKTEFKMLNLNGFKLNTKAPWKLTVESDHLIPIRTVLIKKDFNEKIPGFDLKNKMAPKQEEATVKYTLHAYVCTQDESQCYQEFIKGEHKIEMGKKTSEK